MVTVGAITIFGDELKTISRTFLAESCKSSHRVPLFIFLRVHAEARGAIGAHGLVLISPVHKGLLFFIPVDTLDDLGSDKGAFCDNAFQ